MTTTNQTPDSQDVKLLSKLDIPAAIERELWDIYHQGGTDAKKFMMASNKIFESKAYLIRLITAHQQAAIDQAVAEARKAIESLNQTLDDHWNSPAIYRLTESEIKRITNAQQEGLAALTPKEGKK